MAEQYTFGDRMFQTNQGPMFPAHQFLISGTSAPTEGSHFFAAENTNISFVGGCNAAPKATPMLGPTNCFDFSQSPAPFTSMNAPLDAHYFVNGTRVPEDPDTD